MRGLVCFLAAVVGSLGVSLGLSLGGCNSGPRAEPVPAPSASASTAPAAAPPDDGFFYASVDKTATPLPARFTAAPPSTLAAMEAMQKGDPAAPVQSRVRQLLCTGDAPTLRAVAQALEQAPDAEAPALVEVYADLVRFCDDRTGCGHATELVAGKGRGVALGWALLSRCREWHLATLFNQPDAPATAVVTWHGDSFGNERPEWSDRLGTAAVELAKSGSPELRTAAFAVAHHHRPEAERALAAMHRAAPDAEHKHIVALAMGGAKDPALAALFKAACADGKDPICEVRGDPGGDQPAPAAEPKKTVAELVACVENPARDARPEGCLRDLAELDADRASASAKALLARGIPASSLHELAAALTAYPARGSLATRLSMLGFGGAKPGHEPNWYARSLLESSGFSHSFDAETDQFPNEHDLLSARLAGTMLGKVVFEEIPPPEPTPSRDGTPAPSGHYVIHAYVDGTRYTVKAHDNGDWYDLDAVIGLLNFVARDRGLDIRWVTLATGDQTATVVHGAGASLRVLGEEGVLSWAKPGQAMQVGKDFEERAIREIERNGLPGDR